MTNEREGRIMEDRVYIEENDHRLNLGRRKQNFLRILSSLVFSTC